MFGSSKLANERLRFFQILLRYVEAGISPVDSITRFGEGLDKDDSMAQMTRTMVHDMKNGKTLSEVMKKYPKFFPPFVVGLLEVGQETGQLPKVLQEVTKHLEQDIDIQRKVDSATLVPKISIVGIALLFFFGITYIIPKLGEQLTDMNVEMPFISQVVYEIGLFGQAYWYLLIALAALAFFAFQYFRKQYPEKASLLALKLPIYAPLAYNRLQYDFSKVFGLCIQSGIRPALALKYTTLAIDNVYLKSVLTRAIPKILNAGMKMDAAIKKEDTEGILGKEVYIMIRTGAESGNLGDIMLKESETYEKILKTIVDRIGDKVSLTVLIPSYATMLLLFAAIEYPILTVMKQGPMTTGGM